MPYISSGIPLSGMQDRRRKLSDDDRAEILRLYETGQASKRGLARKYGVNKNSISLIVDPDYRARKKAYISEHWRDYRPSKEEWAATMREHRRYKQSLYLQGELHKEETE
jgi:transposase-like protein